MISKLIYKMSFEPFGNRLRPSSNFTVDPLTQEIPSASWKQVESCWLVLIRLR